MHRILAAAVLGVVTAATSPLLVAPVAPAATAAGVTTTDGCITSVPDPGTEAPVQICYTLFRPAGATKDRARADGAAQPRVGRQPYEGPGVLLLPDRRRLRGAELRPARVRRERRPRLHREPGRRGQGRPEDRRPRRRAGLGQEAEAGRPGARRDRRLVRRRLPVRRRLQRAARQGRDALRRAGPRDHLVEPDREPLPAGRPADGVGRGPHRSRPADRRAAADRAAGLRRDLRDGQRAVVPLRLPRQERAGVARAQRPPARRAGALRPGRDRQPVPAAPGTEELPARAHRQGPQPQHLRRLQRRPHAARRCCPPGRTTTSRWP